LTLIALSIVLPAFVNFAVGLYVVETMLLKANNFAFYDATLDMREKKLRNQALEKAKEIQAQREAAKQNAPARN
jgi:uncharacterized membrane protein required for colicin V production